MARGPAGTVQVGQIQVGRELVSAEEEPWWAQEGCGHMWSFQWDSVGLGTEDQLEHCSQAFGTASLALRACGSRATAGVPAHL